MTLEASPPLNGWILAMSDNEAVGLLVDVAEGYIDVDRLASTLKNSAFTRDLPER